MTKLLLCLALSLTLALTWARPGDEGRGRGSDEWDDEDFWGQGPRGRRPHGRRPPPSAGDFGELAGQMMKQMKGALLDFIGSEMYGDHVFKKMTVILTPDQQKKYTECAKTGLEEMKAHKDWELTPMEKEFVLDRHLGICMLKARFDYTDEKVEKLECCSIKGYFHELLDSGRRNGPKHVKTPPGFRMVEAEFGCFMNLTYGFTFDELKAMRQCMMDKEGVKDEATVQKLLSLLKGLSDESEQEEDKKEGIRLPREADIEACLKQVKPSMSAQDAKDVAFVNTKKREMAKAKVDAQAAKVSAAKRLLALLEKAKN